MAQAFIFHRTAGSCLLALRIQSESSLLQQTALLSITVVIPSFLASLTTYKGNRKVFSGDSFVRDIYEVLRKKQAEQAQLGKQIEALQTAAEQLRSVAHLLNTEEEDDKASHS
jgi:hypothetical protein